MTVTMVKKGKAKAKTASKDTAQELVVAYVEDRLQLEAELAKLSSLQKRVEEQEKLILAMVDENVAADAATQLVAGRYVVKFGPKGQKAVEFDKALIRKKLGADLFTELATFSVTDLKRYLTGEDFEVAVKYAHVNKRRVTVEKAEGQD